MGFAGVAFAMEFFKTSRLRLRNLALCDLDALYDCRNHEECRRYQRWDALSRKDIEAYIRTFQNDLFLSSKAEQHFAICLDTNALVGELAYFYNEKERCVTLGITIAYQHHRKGFAYEMLTEAIRRIRARYPAMDIVGLIDKENVKSIRLFEKLGFEREGYAESIASYVYVLYGKSE